MSSKCVHYVMRGTYFDSVLCSQNSYCGVPSLKELLNTDFSEYEDDYTKDEITETVSGVHVVKNVDYLIIGRIIAKAGANGFNGVVDSYQTLDKNTNQKVRKLFDKLGFASYFKGGRPECDKNAYIFTRWIS